MAKLIWKHMTVAVILNLLISRSHGDNCLEDPSVPMNEEFLSCCPGRPLYTSENCIEAMLEKSKFSPTCLVDCMYKESLIYDGGETIDLAAVKTYLDSKISNEDFNLVYMNAFERCSTFDKSTMTEKFSFLNNTNPHGCDEYPHFVDICVWYYTVAHCPESNANDDDLCKMKNEWVQQCLLED